MSGENWVTLALGIINVGQALALAWIGREQHRSSAERERRIEADLPRTTRSAAEGR
jgi:hypothetical protein